MVVLLVEKNNNIYKKKIEYRILINGIKLFYIIFKNNRKNGHLYLES
jgi:hypothetical protein